MTDLWLERDITRIVEYNRIDTLNTYLVWLRVAYFCGKLGEEDYFNELEQFREFLEFEAEKDANQYIGDFLSKWPL